MGVGVGAAVEVLEAADRKKDGKQKGAVIGESVCI